MALYTLYTFEYSIWAAGESETGFNDGEVEFKSINLVQGENFNPEYLALNPEGTVPMLQAKDGSLYTNTKAAVAELVKHGRIQLNAGSAAVLDAIHDQKYDSNFSSVSVRDEEELKAKAASVQGIFTAGRQAALEKYSTGPGAEPYKAFYEAKLAANGGLLAIYQGKVPAQVTEGFFTQSKAHFDTVSNGLYKVFPDLISSTGLPEDGPAVSDLFLGAWLARISSTVGGKKTEDGLKALETAFGKPLPKKIVTYWNSWSARDSWKKVYAGGLERLIYKYFVQGFQMKCISS
ncbi:hypothetical protein C8J56DRAFT_795674 [Mycena floridula]|nr:hypothetical protein C8J56DRAFT_795674 [Mycena floridula]